MYSSRLDFLPLLRGGQSSAPLMPSAIRLPQELAGAQKQDFQFFRHKIYPIYKERSIGLSGLDVDGNQKLNRFFNIARAPFPKNLRT